MKISRTTNDKLLFTPGPLTTSDTVKAAILHDATCLNRATDCQFVQWISIWHGDRNDIQWLSLANNRWPPV